MLCIDLALENSLEMKHMILLASLHHHEVLPIFFTTTLQKFDLFSLYLLLPAALIQKLLQLSKCLQRS